MSYSPQGHKELDMTELLTHTHTDLFIFWTVLGLRCCAQAFSSCWEWGVFSSCGVWASHCGGFPCEAWALGRTGFSSCDTQA